MHFPGLDLERIDSFLPPLRDLQNSSSHCLSFPQAGFKHDYNSVSQDIPPYDHLLRVLPRCFTEVMLRVANPLRPIIPSAFKNGPKGSAAFVAFQKEMSRLLDEIAALPELPADDTDIGTQLVRAMRAHPEIGRDRVLSEIGILFVEGFETTGEMLLRFLLKNRINMQSNYDAC